MRLSRLREPPNQRFCHRRGQKQNAECAGRGELKPHVVCRARLEQADQQKRRAERVDRLRGAAEQRRGQREQRHDSGALNRIGEADHRHVAGGQQDNDSIAQFPRNRNRKPRREQKADEQGEVESGQCKQVPRPGDAEVVQHLAGQATFVSDGNRRGKRARFARNRGADFVRKSGSVDGQRRLDPQPE